MTGPVEAPGVDDRVRSELVRFVRALRGAGASVPANAATTAARALVEVGLDDRDRARTALRAGLLTDREDFETFDRLFEAFWRRLGSDPDAGRSPPDESEPGGGLAPLGPRIEDSGGVDRTDDGAGDTGGDEGRAIVESFAVGSDAGDDADGDGEGTTTALYSPSGSASAVEGRPLSGEAGLGPAFRELTRALAGLQGRRYRPGTDHADVRRALRASVSTGGTPLSVPRRERKRTAVRALLLVDVSRSMLDVLDRGFLVEFLRRARREWRDARVFLFDEELREASEPFDAPSATVAMEALEAAEAAWGGGTRIGGSLASLHGTYPEAVDRRTAVLLVGDGLEMGDVSTLEHELSWLSRRAMRVLWLNPLAAGEHYEPTARGMAAALPYLDGLFAFAAPGDVAELARQLRRQGPGGRIGYEFDPRTTHRPTTTRTENDA
ncbi:MAG: VWA domain-containing protein [Haloarculaceae archaeon]